MELSSPYFITEECNNRTRGSEAYTKIEIRN